MHGIGLGHCLVIVVNHRHNLCTNLKELARQCEFTNKEEIVKFLFLIHNKHERVREELLKSVMKDTSLNQCLEFA